MKTLSCLLALLMTASAALALDYSVLESLPIQEGGRKKPYLVFAEESLMSLSGKSDLVLDGAKRNGSEIITSIWLQPEGWSARPLIFINHKPLKEAIGLDPAEKLFAYDALAGNTKLLALLNEAQTLRAQPGNQRLSGLPKEAADVGLRMAKFEALENGSAFRFIASPRGADAAWFAVPNNTAALAPLRAAFLANDAAAFTKESEALQKSWASVEPQFQPPAWKIQLEEVYQRTHPFGWAWRFYLAAGLALLFLPKGRGSYLTAWSLALIGFLLQVAGFAARVLISGRAPVTNMYESVLWVAFGTILFALIFEAIYRSRYFLLGAVPVAVVSLILADTQTVALNRSISPLVPVLRDNFWLSTHVTSITLSYAAFALALGIAHIILGQVIWGRKPGAPIYNYLYRTLQVGVLLLATGTILGGVWANYSWGRFWDWDPKETWALITLLGYLIVLHGRIAGKWGGFGLAIGAVLSFLCVLMAWYGVNFVLGVGLHSYGFGTGGFGWALIFVLAEIAFVAIALMRRKSLPPETIRTTSPAPRELAARE